SLRQPANTRNNFSRRCLTGGLNQKRSIPPHSHPINLHLLREYSGAVRTADEVSTNCDVEQNEERSLKLRGAVYATRNVCLSILHSIDVPLVVAEAAVAEIVAPVRGAD